MINQVFGMNTFWLPAYSSSPGLSRDFVLISNDSTIIPVYRSRRVCLSWSMRDTERGRKFRGKISFKANFVK